MRRGAATEAEALLKDAEAAAVQRDTLPAAEIRRALAAAFLQTGRYEEVIGCVDPETDGAEARYHVGLAYAKLQRYAMLTVVCTSLMIVTLHWFLYVPEKTNVPGSRCRHAAMNLRGQPIYGH